jgi:hypothetical protein
MIPARCLISGWNTRERALALFLHSVDHPWRVIPVSDGLSLVTKLSARILSMMMGIWFLSRSSGIMLPVSWALLGEDAQGCLLPHDSGNGTLQEWRFC